MENDALRIDLKKSIDEAEKELKRIDGEIKNARAIGADVSALESEYESQKRQIELIKRVYKI